MFSLAWSESKSVLHPGEQILGHQFQLGALVGAFSLPPPPPHVCGPGQSSSGGLGGLAYRMPLWTLLLFY